MTMPTTYLAGVRNLDAAETTERRNSGWIGLALTLVASGAMFYFQVNPLWRWLLFFPVALMAIGFLQAWNHFCVMVALSSRSPASTAAERKKDQRQALRLIAAAIAFSSLITLVAYWW